MATVEITTLAPMTMTPDASSITTLAPLSGSTRQLLDARQRFHDVTTLQVKRHRAWVGRPGDCRPSRG